MSPEPDAFESEVQKFVSAQNGGELTARIVYDMLVAVDKDGNARHEETMARLDAVEKMQADHWAWTNRESLPRLQAVEERQRAWEEGCPARQEAIHAEHLSFHNAHMEADHAPHRVDDEEGADWTDRRKEHAVVVGDAPLGPPFTVVVVCLILVGLAIAATLMYVDRENAAGRVLLILMPIVTLGGWWISGRKK
jgi:hypothetical protein